MTEATLLREAAQKREVLSHLKEELRQSEERKRMREEEERREVEKAALERDQLDSRNEKEEERER